MTRAARRAPHRLVVHVALAAFAAMTTACAATPPMPEPPPSHPASPAADEAPERAPSQTLTMPARTPPDRESTKPMRGH